MAKHSALVVFVLCIPVIAGFAPLVTAPWDVGGQPRAIVKARSTELRASSSDESSSNSGNNNFDSLLESLKQRQLELQEDQNQRVTKWKTADCSSAVQLVLPNWVRRLDVEYPLVACGSGRGDVYVGHLETGDVVAIGQVEHNDDETAEILDTDNNKRLEKVVRVLFNGYDGGGTLAMAFRGGLICEGRRSGGVYIWRLDPDSDRLVPQGSIPALDGDLVTALHLDADHLWVGTVDGHLQAFSLEEDLPLALQNTPEMVWQFGETITSLSLSPEHGCGAAATSAGSVHIFSLEDEDIVVGSFFPPFDSSERKAIQAFPSSVTFVGMKNNNSSDDDAGDKNKKKTELMVASGGNDGSIFLQPVELTSTGEVNTERPFTKPLRPLRPRHFGPAKCLCSPLPGILVSAGQDGGMRVWDVAESMCLYQFVGYKVWMGSLWTDGYRLVSDGADNTVIVHDFTKGSEP